MARTGKIARLPLALRTELNQRLRDGQLGPALLPWLNSLPEVRAILEAEFGNKDINAQNLSDWRNGGYVDWLNHQDRFHHTKLLAERSVELARAAGGNLAEGASAILAGQILEVLESLGDLRDMVRTAETPGADEKAHDRLLAAAEAIDNLTNSVAKLRSGDQVNVKLKQAQQDLERKDKELAMAGQRFQRDTCELFVRWAQDQRATELAASNTSHADKIAALGQLMFGDDWKPSDATRP